MRPLDDHLVRILHEAVLRHREDAPTLELEAVPILFYFFILALVNLIKTTKVGFKMISDWFLRSDL